MYTQGAMFVYEEKIMKQGKWEGTHSYGQMELRDAGCPEVQSVVSFMLVQERSLVHLLTRTTVRL